MTVNIHRHYLEIKNLKDLHHAKKPCTCNIELINPPDFQINKFFYKQIGKKHKWIDRLIWSNNQWINYIEKSKVKTFVLKENNNFVGYYEQINNKGDSELAYFGILEEFIGKKFGGYLLSFAIENSLNNGSKRVWVHTCSLDHKNALPNYLARGMKIFKSETIKLKIN